MARKVFLRNREGDIPLFPFNDSIRVKYTPLDRTVEDVLTELLNRKHGADENDLQNIINQINNINERLDGGEGIASVRMSVKATYTVGGVPKGRVYTDELVTKIVHDILSPYVPPTITATGGRILTSGKVYNIPVNVSIEQGSTDISSIKFDGRTVNLTNDTYSEIINFNPASDRRVIHIVADDETESVSQDVVFEVYEGLYIIFSPNIEPSSLNINECHEVGKTPDGIYSVENNYTLAYPFFFVSNRSRIDRIVANNIEVPKEYLGERTLMVNGALGQYKVYKGTQRANQGTITYYINPK